jgi:hypothetical protein
MTRDLEAVLLDLHGAVLADAARHRTSRCWPRSSRGRRLVIALAAAVLLALAGTAVAVRTDLLSQQEQFHARVPDDPARIGPFVEIASGDDWALIAWQSNVGLCLDFAVPGNSSFDCDFPVRGAKPETSTGGAGPPTHAIAGFVSGGGLVGGDGKTSIFGVAAAGVAAVRIELAGGQEVDASLHDPPPTLDADVRFFLVRLPLPPQGLDSESPVRAYEAYDQSGMLLERAGT